MKLDENVMEAGVSRVYFLCQIQFNSGMTAMRQIRRIILSLVSNFPGSLPAFPAIWSQKYTAFLPRTAATLLRTGDARLASRYLMRLVLFP